MKKIAVITPFLANGGAERVAITEAEWLGRYFDVTLIVMDSFRVDYPYDGKVIDMKVSLMNRNVIKRIYNLVLSIYRLKKLKNEHCFDLVISHGELGNLPNILSGGKKNIVTVHENRFAAIKDIQGKMVNKLIRYLYSYSNVCKVITVSEGIRQSLILSLDIDPQKVQTIYNPYRIDEIQKLSNESNEFMDKLGMYEIIITAGRLTFAKGQWYLLRIFKTLKETNNGMKLVFLGDGEMKSKLVALSENLGLKTYTVWSGASYSDEYDVYFMGFQKNPYSYIKNAKLFVMTSLWEGFGGTIVESMACGTPVSSTNCPSGPGEIVHPEIKDYRAAILPDMNGCGILMPNFKNEYNDTSPSLSDVEKTWVEIIQKFLTDEAKRDDFIVKGLERAYSFDQKVIMEEWKQLIDACVQS